MEAVVKAINTHIDNPGVCVAGCGALRNMMYNNGKSITTNNKQNENEQLRTK